AENAKLKQIIEENARRDARVEELEQKNTELEARLAIVEQGSSVVDDQLHKEAISKRFVEQTVSDVDLSSSVTDQRNNDDAKTSEEKEMDKMIAKDSSSVTSDMTHCEEDPSMTSAELVTLPEQVVKESIPACKSVTSSNKSSAGTSPVKSPMADKQVLASENTETECQKIPYNQKVEQDLRRELSSTEVGDGKINKAFDIQIPELSLEAILIGSSEVTAQNIVDLFRVAMKLRRKEILCWEFSSENFDYYGITGETSCPLCSLDHDDEESIEGRYKKETGNEPYAWQLSEAVINTSSVPQVILSNKSRLPISILPEDPEEKRKHIIGLVLERFPYLSLVDSNERADSFSLNSSILCPLCKGVHKEKSIFWDDIRGLPASSNLISLLPKIPAGGASTNARIEDAMGNVVNVTLSHWNVNLSAEELSGLNAIVQELALHTLESHRHYTSPSVSRRTITKRTSAKRTVVERTTPKKTIVKRRSVRIKNMNKKKK
ncbi:hypothetical protein RhiirA4_431335, partial [Rhizophagus irregularis]